MKQLLWAADLDAQEGTPADEADVELKSDASESAIWRLTAGKGERGLEGALPPLRKSGSAGSGDYSGAEKTGEPTSERKTSAGRIDFVLQVRMLWTHVLLAGSYLHKQELVQLPLHMSPVAKAQCRTRLLGWNSSDCCVDTAWCCKSKARHCVDHTC